MRAPTAWRLPCAPVRAPQRSLAPPCPHSGVSVREGRPRAVRVRARAQEAEEPESGDEDDDATEHVTAGAPLEEALDDFDLDEFIATRETDSA